MERKTNTFILKVKEMSNGKFLLSSPDFEGITMTSETEENISTVASNLIKAKINELKKNNLEIPEPKKIKEVLSTLSDGEFTIFTTISSFNIDIKNLSENLKNEKNIREINSKIDSVIDENVRESIPNGAELLMGVAGCIFSLINTLFLTLISLDVVFFNFKVGFFRGMGTLAKEVGNFGITIFLIRFSGIILVLLTLCILASLILKRKDLLKISLLAKVGFLLVFYVIFFIRIMTIERHMRSLISISFLKIVIYIVSIVLITLSYKLLNTNKSEKID